MLHIYPRIPNQTFDELPFEEEILAFLRYLGHSGEIKKITDVNINKLHQPWRSSAAVINKCLSGKSTRDDQMFTTIKLVSRHQNTQQFGAMLPVELTNKDIKNSAAYKEYYTIASGAAPPKTKAKVYKATTDQLDWNNPEGQQYPHNLLKPLPLIPNSRGHRVIPFDHFINNDLEYLCGGAFSRKYTTFVTKTKAADYGHIKWIEDLIIEWHNYKHLDWITVHRDDYKLYKFKEGDFKRHRIQDIKDMLLLLVQGKLTNLTVKEHFAFNVSLRMFTRCIVIQRRVEDLQLRVKSYQKKLNLIKSATYKADLKCKEAYTVYSNPRGFIYQNKDKQNRYLDEVSASDYLEKK
nr:hypothetical protein [Tanacetum cinerariifolium]